MINYIVRRIISSFFTLLIVVTILFFSIHLLPGDPVLTILGGEESNPDPKAIEFLTKELGLDAPLPIQYYNWIKGVARFDLGSSLITKQDISSQVVIRLSRTLLLIFPALTISLVFGIILGMITAFFQRSIIDSLTSGIILIGYSTPVFVSGLIMVLVFAIHLEWLPSAGFVSPLDDFTGFLRRATLPIISLSIPFLAVVMRLTRSSVLEQLRLDYVLAARAKGLKELTVLMKHILRNALIPVITVTGIQVGRMIGGSLLVETIYNWPGISSFLINAVRVRDYPVVQGTMLAVSVIFLAINVIVDISYAFIDPQIRYERS